MSNHNPEQIDGMKIREEEIGYSSDQMLACSKCGKANPPNRANCLYCAGPVENFVAGSDTPKLNLRRLENWENGFNVIALSPRCGTGTSELAKIFGPNADEIESLLEASHSVPLARFESESDAVIAKDHLARFEMDAVVVSDVMLKMGKPNVRSRSVEFLPDAILFVSFNTGKSTIVPVNDIALVVTGTVTESKFESIEKGRKKTQRKSISESSTTSDDLVVDVYTGDDEQGWRIMTKGFDFSCLGDEKVMLAGENIRRLVERIRASAPHTKFVEEYDHVGNAMSAVWEIESRKDFEGIKRTGFLRSGFSSVVRTTNVDQFSKYSRLQRILL